MKSLSLSLLVLSLAGCGILKVGKENNTADEQLTDQEGPEIDLSSVEAAELSLWSFGAHNSEEFLARFDVDNDGEITSDEQNAAKEAFIAEHDENGDGSLNKKELWTALFSYWDEDGDGKLNQKERETFLEEKQKSQSVRWQALKEKLEKLRLNRFDRDGDGELSEDEKAAAGRSRLSSLLARERKPKFCDRLEKTTEKRDRPLLQRFYERQCKE